jgi:hypothetical protein
VPVEILVGDRIFAQVLGFTMQCPRCGAMHGRGSTYRYSGFFNPRTQRIHCTECNFKAVVGIVLWPIKPGAAARPDDAMPTARQQLRLKQLMVSSVWVEATKDQRRAWRGRRGQQANVLAQEIEIPDSGPPDVFPSKINGGAGRRFKQAHKDVEGRESE